MIRPDEWADLKEKIMLKGLRAKFSQNKNIRDRLL